jgi:thiopeptide-type bacteriocin biosynthesis protein
LPRWIAVVDGDNELPIDLDNVLAVDTLVELIKGRDHATLVELFPGPDELVASGPEGRFVHELVVPFVRRESGEKTSQPAEERAVNNFPQSRPSLREGTFLRGAKADNYSRPVSEEAPTTDHGASDRRLLGPVRRTFPPGSEWLYAKLYAGPATVDQLLRDVVQPVIETALSNGAVDRWFFIRYGDPDWHLRVRFHGQPARLHGEVLPALQAAAAPLLDDGRLWRLQLDTYEREVERYGGALGVELAERLFHADSEAVLALAARLPEDARGDLRWRLAVLGMDRLLSDLLFDSETRHEIIRRARDSFAAEFRADAGLQHQLGTKFRPERTGLEALLESTPGGDDRLAPGTEVLRIRSERLVPIFDELRSCARAGRLTVSMPELAVSYLHMHANRLLRSAHRAQELVLYDFLARLYESRVARALPRAIMAWPAGLS